MNRLLKWLRAPIESENLRLRAKIASLKEELERKQKQLDDERRRVSDDWFAKNTAERERDAALERVKEVEAEKEVILRAITGIGPTLLAALSQETTGGEK